MTNENNPLHAAAGFCAPGKQTFNPRDPEQLDALMEYFENPFDLTNKWSGVFGTGVVQHVPALIEEVKRLRGDLGFYADPKNSRNRSGLIPGVFVEVDGVIDFYPDRGERAREALKTEDQ